MTLNDIKKGVVGLLYLPQWWMQALQKRDPYLWTFDAWSGTDYSDNPRALYEYVLANEPKIQAVWTTNSQKVYDRLKREGKPVVMRHSKEGRRIQKRAGFFFCTHGRLCDVSEGELKYMHGIRFFNLWHGAPLKQIGDDETQFKQKTTLKKRFFTAIRRVIVPWEFLSGDFLSSGPFFEPFIRSAFGRCSRIFGAYEPRLDYLFSQNKEQLVERLDKQYNHPLKVMYMPTFRDSQFGNCNPFEMAGYDAERMRKLLESENIVLLYKGHFLDSSVQEGQHNERIILVGNADYDNLYALLKDVDVLITDYSSVYFDFLCTRKPMILFPFDYEEYTTQSRPFYFDYSLMQATKVHTWSELEDCLKNQSYHQSTQEEVERFRPGINNNCCATLCAKLLSEIE